jgi:predicted N-acetyltransferase YhbS
LKDITIRLENESDWHNVELVAREAFWREERIEEICIGATEHYMIHNMRGNILVKELSFVAELNGHVIGHIVFSSGSHIEQKDGTCVDVLNMGPISVKPEFQKNGIGSMLIKQALIESKRLGYGAIFFYGHADYYPRFGFKDASVFNVTTYGGGNNPSFMGMELKDGYLDGVAGKFIEDKIYDEEYTGPLAKAFDQSFR